MRQVPHYLIVGRGRLATHMARYFTLLGVAHTIWHRELSLDYLKSASLSATHALILIKDDVIEPFLLEHGDLFSHLYVIHCSGALTTKLAIGAHPLMTFIANANFSLQQYCDIPFVVEEGAPNFLLLFPNFKNPVFYISPEKKSKYHALCTLSGNLTSFLWQQFFDFFQKELGFSKEIGFPYLQQTANNLLTDSDNALTGPVSRNDIKTINKHMSALQDNYLHALYTAFITTFSESKKEHNK